MASITEVAPAIAAPATKNQKLIQWVEEIAQLHRVSVSAVKSRLARGRARLRAYYERQLEDEAVPVFGENSP